MTDELAASLPRRVLAWVIDFGIVGALSAAVALTQAETFPSAAELLNSQRDRMAEITSGPSVSWTLGETTRIWAGNALWTTVAATILILLIVLALLPANVGGWTPGMRLAGLRVITVSGNRARLHHHVIRNVVGLIDMFPFVVPGLLGWIVAWRSPDKQRLGDRAAGTRVVDQRHPERPIDPGAHRSRWKQMSEEPSPQTPAVFDEMEAATKNWAVLDVDADLPPAVAHTVARTVEEGRLAGAKPLDKILPPIRRDQRRTSSISGRPPAPLPASERKPAPAPEPIIPDDPEPIIADDTGRPVGDTPFDTGSKTPSEEVDADLDPTVDMFRRMALGAPADLPEIATDPTAVPGPGPEPKTGDDDGPTTQHTVWSDQLGAWMYRDANTGRWLKHEPETDRWVPVD